MKSILSSLVMALSLCLFLFACSKSAQKAGGSVSKNEPQMTGNDKDERGCIGSAGYQWSVLKKECVRLFEVGTSMAPKAAGLDQTLSAFVVFKAPGADAQAEIFVPSQPSSILLNKSGDGTWKNKAYILTEWNGGYSLEDASGKLLYQKDGK